jgi:predicted regulator of Ras-like GTPase activity (Roadblock/LC7/MglB family)
LFEAHFQRILQKVEGARAVALIGRDGLAVSRLGATEEPDLDLVTAMLADLAGRFQQASDEAGAGPVGEIVSSTERYRFLLRAATPDYLLLAVLDADGSLGRARFELQRAARLLRDDLV